MNQYVSEMIERIDHRFAVDASDMSLGDWICENTKLRGRPFNFNRYPFQKQIADDMHNNMDVIKPSQVGLSEVQVRKTLGILARYRGTSAIFTLPNDDMFERMSKARILPVVRDNRVFNMTDEKQTRSKELIQIGQSFLYVTGAKEGDATSISADFVFNDEVDLTDQQMLSLFSSRLQNSDWKVNQRFSTPTFHGFGIDEGFQRSDQHEFMCRCISCNHWNIPVFEEKFIDLPGLPADVPLLEIDEQMIDAGIIHPADAQVVCEKCRAPLDLSDMSLREWVPRYAQRTHHRGYRVSPFSTDRLSPEYIIGRLFWYRGKDFMRGFFNTVLGQAFTPGSARLSDAEIVKCFTPRQDEPSPRDNSMPTWLGIDVGRVCHLIVSQGYSEHDQNVVLFEVVPADKLIERVEELCQLYNVVGGACDRHPYTPTAEGLRDATQGRILPVEYRGTRDVNLVKDQLEEDKVTHGQVNRTSMIDGFVKMVRTGRTTFSGYGKYRSAIIEHLKDMVRDEQPEKPATWVKLNGNDHFFHAGAFLYAGIKLQELNHGLYSDNRSTVHVGTATLNENVSSHKKTRAGF